MTEEKRIELCLLGEMRVHGTENGAERKLAGQTKRLALLAYLALEPGFHRRESVMDLFWPESDPDAARRALRQSLYALGKTLGRKGVFEKRGDEIRVDSSHLWCDAPALERACDEGDEETVVQLFRGELLPGFHIDDASPDLQRAFDDARTRIHRKGLRKLRDLAERASREGRHDAAIRYARQALTAAPHDEPSLRILVSALAAAGDRVEAVRVGATFVERLESEMGLEPDPETLAAIHAAEERPGRAVCDPESRPLPSTLPHPLTSLVGRADEIELAVKRLGRADVRMLTLTGPGGVGKSRLAIEIAERVASRYADGVAWVNLDVYSDPEAALLAIARVVDAEVGEEACARAALRERLAGLDALLVLDGLDRVPDSGAAIAEILGTAPDVDALLTSRTPVGLSAEHRLPVSPLSLPERGRHVGVDLPLDSEAVALFVDRSRAADPEFALSTSNVGAVIEICLRLDGLPLAIELAAGRTCHLPVEEIARRLEGDLGLLKGDARDRPERHETLDAAIRWTSEQLSDEERALLLGLGAFVGDFDLSMLEATWEDLGPPDHPALDLLSVLIDRGLVHSVRDSEGRPRYRLLRTIRDHAAAALEESGRRAAWLRRLAEQYAGWVQRGFKNYCGPGEAEWLVALDREAPNLEAIVDWAIEAEPRLAAGIVSPIVHWWTSRGMIAHARRRVERVLEAGGPGIETGIRGRLLVSLGMLSQMHGDHDEAVERSRQALEVYREAGDTSGHGYALQSYSRVLMNLGQFDEALAAAEEGLAIGERTGNAHRVDQCGNVIARIAHHRGDLERAEPLYARALSRARAVGSLAGETLPLINLAQIEIHRGRPELAERYAREALRIAESLGNANHVAYASAVLADARRALGRPDEVHALYASALDLYRRMGEEEGMATVLTALAEVILEAGENDQALRLVASLTNRIEEQGVRYPPLLERLEGVAQRIRDRLGVDVWEREIASTRGVTLERLLQWAEEGIPTVEIRFAAR